MGPWETTEASHSSSESVGLGGIYGPPAVARLPPRMAGGLGSGPQEWGLSGLLLEPRGLFPRGPPRPGPLWAGRGAISGGRAGVGRLPAEVPSLEVGGRSPGRLGCIRPPGQRARLEVPEYWDARPLFQVGRLEIISWRSGPGEGRALRKQKLQNSD